MRVIIATFAALLLSACSTNPIYLSNAAGKTVQCGPFPATDYINAAAAPQREAQCISDFQRQGYERVSGKPAR